MKNEKTTQLNQKQINDLAFHLIFHRVSFEPFMCSDLVEYTAARNGKQQVYCFAKRNVLSLDLSKSRGGFFRRGKERPFPVQGTKTGKARLPGINPSMPKTKNNNKMRHTGEQTLNSSMFSAGAGGRVVPPEGTLSVLIEERTNLKRENFIS